MAQPLNGAGRSADRAGFAAAVPVMPATARGVCVMAAIRRMPLVRLREYELGVAFTGGASRLGGAANRSPRRGFSAAPGPSWAFGLYRLYR